MIQKENFFSKYIFSHDTPFSTNLHNAITISNVTSSKEFKTFYEIPWTVYAKDTNWVAPFWTEIRDFFKTKNPFWNHTETQLFIAKKQGKPIGRIAAIIDNKFCEKNQKKIGFFGFFECINNFDVATALFQSAEQWLQSKKITTMWGPINGRVDNGFGFLQTGFHTPPTILGTYSPEYYLQFAEQYGMTKAIDQIVYYIDLTKPFPKKLQENAQQSKASGITIRPFNRLQTNKELSWWIDLFLETFADHWGFVQAPNDEVRKRFGVKQLRWFVDSKLFLIAQNNGSPVAYLWATPDYNQLFKTMNGKLTIFNLIRFLIKKKTITEGKLQFIGIKKEYRNQNIGSFLNYEILTEMKKRGYTGAEAELEENNPIAHATIAKTGATVNKIFRVFEKSIQNKSEV